MAASRPRPIAPLVDLRLRLRLGEDIAMGPGKADLLEAIDATGSISAAAKSLGMSYRRAWLLVETMNKCFRTPLVQAKTGGKSGGGAEITPLGRDAVRAYRAMQAAADKATAKALPKLAVLLR